MSETGFRIAFILLFVTLTFLRGYFKIRARILKRGLYSRSEGLGIIVARTVLGVPLLFAMGVYMFDIGGFGWMYLPIPIVLQVVGTLKAVAALVLLTASHVALGDNFSTTLVFRNHHRLITKGPYRFIQHPIYVSYVCLFTGGFCISGNWVIGASGTGIILLLMTVRLKREEALLERKFGKQYETYKNSTGRFFPNLLTQQKESSVAESDCELPIGEP